jgi:hypothetical protein
MSIKGVPPIELRLQSMAITGNHWQSLAITGNQFQSMLINVNQGRTTRRASPAINGNHL